MTKTLEKTNKKESQENTRIKLNNVRLSFPSLFKKAIFKGDETKYEATFLIPKTDKKTKDIIDKRIEELIKESKVKVPRNNLCLKDGDEIYEDKDYEGYQDTWVIKASTNKRPTVINRDKTPIAEDDNIIYAGCYVNASIDLWVQNNEWGKRVNANLYGVQFLKDGEAFGMGAIDATSDFEELEDIDDFEEEDDL